MTQIDKQRIVIEPETKQYNINFIQNKSPRQLSDEEVEKNITSHLGAMMNRWHFEYEQQRLRTTSELMNQG